MMPTVSCEAVGDAWSCENADICNRGPRLCFFDFWIRFWYYPYSVSESDGNHHVERYRHLRATMSGPASCASLRFEDIAATGYGTTLDSERCMAWTVSRWRGVV